MKTRLTASVLAAFLLALSLVETAQAKTFPRLKNGYAVIVLNNISADNDLDAHNLYALINAKEDIGFAYKEKAFSVYGSTFMFSCRVRDDGFGTCTVKLIAGPYTSVTPDAGKASFQVGGPDADEINQYFKSDSNGEFRFLSSDKKTLIELRPGSFTFLMNEAGVAQ